MIREDLNKPAGNELIERCDWKSGERLWNPLRHPRPWRSRGQNIQSQMSAQAVL